MSDVDVGSVEQGLAELETRIRAAHMVPTWVDVKELVPMVPSPSYAPHQWRWVDTEPLLLDAGRLITPERGAERRSIDHSHPELRSKSTTHTLGSAFQLVLPGEVAPAHRHAAGAIRFVFQSEGGLVYSTVEGEQHLMEQHDLILTPSGTWHDHGNETQRPIVWFDALDYPFVNYLHASFFQPHTDDRQALSRERVYTALRTGRVRPLGESHPDVTPAIRYPWAEARDALAALASTTGDPYVLVEYHNPGTPLGSVLPTMSCLAGLLAPGGRSEPSRSTSSEIHLVLTGTGTSTIGGRTFRWQPGDVLVVPPWTEQQHANDGDTESYRFVVSDKPVAETFGLLRYERS